MIVIRYGVSRSGTVVFLIAAIKRTAVRTRGIAAYRAIGLVRGR
jgi:hypothetical protein